MLLFHILRLSGEPHPPENVDEHEPELAVEEEETASFEMCSTLFRSWCVAPRASDSFSTSHRKKRKRPRRAKRVSAEEAREVEEAAADEPQRSHSDEIVVAADDARSEATDVLESDKLARNTSLLKHYVLLFCLGVLAGWLLSVVEAPKERRLKNRAFRRGNRVKAVVDEGISNGWFDDGFKKDLKQLCNFVSDDERDIINFDIAGSTFFLASVVTTIGYGTYTPLTTWGKIITSLTAIFGVAWFGFILTIAASRAEGFVRFVVIFWQKGVNFARSKFTSKDVARINRDLFTHALVFKRMLIVNIVYIVLLACMGFASGVITIGNAFYMSIITFTTVGLGDFAPPFHNASHVPARERTLELFFLTVIAFVGLTLLALLLNALEKYTSYSVSTFLGRTSSGLEIPIDAARAQRSGTEEQNPNRPGDRRATPTRKPKDSPPL